MEGGYVNKLRKMHANNQNFLFAKKIQQKWL